MKVRDMAMMALGGTAVLAYQKYNKPMMKSVKKSLNETVKNANKSLDDMMGKYVK